jgi:hypothetical protein
VEQPFQALVGVNSVGGKLFQGAGLAFIPGGVVQKESLILLQAAETALLKAMETVHNCLLTLVQANGGNGEGQEVGCARAQFSF